MRLPLDRRRGTAEIELILSVVVLITILMLVQGATRLGAARLEQAGQASFEAFRSATLDRDPPQTTDGEMTPIDGLGAERPGLPNRTHVPRLRTEVSVYAGDRQSLPSTIIGGKAALAGPPWTFTAYPVGGADAADTEAWFDDYASESHAYLSNSLRLQPAWTP